MSELYFVPNCSDANNYYMYENYQVGVQAKKNILNKVINDTIRISEIMNVWELPVNYITSSMLLIEDKINKIRVIRIVV